MPAKRISVSELLEKYREAAEGTAEQNPKIQNKWADELHRYYKLLRATDEGRSAIMTLLTDPSPHVRVWAGAHSLEWAPAAARAALEILRDSDGPCSFDAKMTLREYDRGRLRFE